ncbi:unnamed protein product [Alopecurus aequalis]
MTPNPTCTICGREPEDEFHATMCCTKSVPLRNDIRKFWKLLSERSLQNTGEDWVLNILNNVDPDTRAKLMMLWWWAWHLRNNIIFGDGKAEIAHSSAFLNTYFISISNLRDGNPAADLKGKKPVDDQKENLNKGLSTTKFSQWKPPENDWLCLSVDASYIQDTNFASWGALIRDHHGQILLSAWGLFPNCDSAETAEALACLEGIKCSIPLVDSGLIIESDCANIIKKITKAEIDRSYTSSVVLDIQRLVDHFPRFRFCKIAREDNRPAHELARLGRVECSAGVLQGSAPSCVLELALRDCNQNINSI